jgi:SnoaL-like domain
MNADDYQAITNLVHGYARLLDCGDFDGVGKLFADATVRIQGQDAPFVRDAPAVSDMFRDFVRLYDGVPRTRHQMANLIIEADGADAAVGWCSVVVFQQAADLALQPIITGDYHDRFVKIGGAWRFDERRIANDLFGNLNAHGKWQYVPPAAETTEEDS